MGLPLVMAGIVQDREYFDRCVAPHVDGRAGAVPRPGRARPARRRARRSAALLHLISFDEPFGFSVVEAMACGTPVVAFRRGSMPELVDDGRTGFLVDDVEEAAGALRRVGDLDRAAIRKIAVERFGRDRMVDDYLAAYDSVLDGRRRAD